MGKWKYNDNEDTRAYKWVDKWYHHAPTADKQLACTPDEWKTYFVKLSKSLGWMVRWGAASEGLMVRTDGFVPLKDVMRHRRFKQFCSRHVKVLVQHDPSRYALKTEDFVVLVGEVEEGNTRTGKCPKKRKRSAQEIQEYYVPRHVDEEEGEASQVSIEYTFMEVVERF
jgi:hypothetical protein